jgi:hypothetical protein
VTISIAQASAFLWLRVLYLPRRSAGLLLTFIRRQSIAVAAPQRRNAALSLTLGIGALCGAVAIWALRDQQEINLDTSTVVTVRNETVVYKQALPPEPIVQESTRAIRGLKPEKLVRFFSTPTLKRKRAIDAASLCEALRQAAEERYGGC